MMRFGPGALICLFALCCLAGCNPAVQPDASPTTPAAVAANVEVAAEHPSGQRVTRKLSCPIRAFATSDNDIRIDRDPRAKGKPVVLPDAVAALASKVVAERLVRMENDNTLDSEGAAWLWNHCEDVFGPAFRLTAPDGLQVYVVSVSLSIFGESYCLIPYDPRNGRMTAKPLNLSAKWTNGFGFENGLNRAPIIRFERSNDGAQQLVFSEYAHNGNVYNAVIERRFEFAEDLSLEQVMAVETKVLIPTGNGTIIRKLVSIGPGRYRIDVVQRIRGEADKAVGSYTMLRQAAGQAFRTGSFGSLSVENRLTLVTYCMEARDPDRFQQHACDFYY